MENKMILEVIEGKMEQAAAHHDFIYVDGKKIPKEIEGCVYDYRDEYGLLHSTKHVDIALANSVNNKCVKTNVHTAAEGLPKVGGSVYTIFGAGKDYVYFTKNKGEADRYHTKDFDSNAKKVVYSPSNPVKKEACELLRQIYMELV